jgi:hypothetical protein
MWHNFILGPPGTSCKPRIRGAVATIGTVSLMEGGERYEGKSGWWSTTREMEWHLADKNENDLSCLKCVQICSPRNKIACPTLIINMFANHPNGFTVLGICLQKDVLCFSKLNMDLECVALCGDLWGEWLSGYSVGNLAESIRKHYISVQ